MQKYTEEELTELAQVAYSKKDSVFKLFALEELAKILGLIEDSNQKSLSLQLHQEETKCAVCPVLLLLKNVLNRR